MEKPPSVTKPFIYLPQDHGTIIAPKGKKAVSQNSSTNKTHDDSSGNENSIQIREGGKSNFYIYLELVDYEKPIKIQVYNLLGKKVLDVYDGMPYKDKDSSYVIYEDKLQNGVYMCVVQGNNFRLLEKFIVSR
jgi:hypothetical protein